MFTIASLIHVSTSILLCMLLIKKIIVTIRCIKHQDNCNHYEYCNCDHPKCYNIRLSEQLNTIIAIILVIFFLTFFFIY